MPVSRMAANSHRAESNGAESNDIVDNIRECVCVCDDTIDSFGYKSHVTLSLRQNEVNNLRVMIVFQRDHVRYRKNNYNNNSPYTDTPLDHVARNLPSSLYPAKPDILYLGELILLRDSMHGDILEHDCRDCLCKSILMIISQLSFYEITGNLILDSTEAANTICYSTIDGHISCDDKEDSNIFLGVLFCYGVSSTSCIRGIWKSDAITIWTIPYHVTIYHYHHVSITESRYKMILVVIDRGDNCYSAAEILDAKMWSSGVFYTHRLVRLLTQHLNLNIFHHRAVWGDVRGQVVVCGISYSQVVVCGILDSYSDSCDSHCCITAHLQLITMCHCERVTEHFKVTEHWIIVIPCHYFSATEHYEVTEHWIIIIPCHYFSATDHRYIIIPCHYFTIPYQYLIVKVTVHWLIAYTPGLMGLIIAHWLISCLHLTANGLVTPFGSISYPPDLYYCDVQRFGSYGHVDISYFKGDCHSFQVADIEHYMSSTKSNSPPTTLIDIKATSTTCEVFEILVIAPSSDNQDYSSNGTFALLSDPIWAQHAFTNFKQRSNDIVLVLLEKNGESSSFINMRDAFHSYDLSSVCTQHLPSLLTQHRSVVKVLCLGTLFDPDDVPWGGNYGAQAYDLCNDRRIILFSIEYDEAVIAEDNMACSWGASGYLSVCIFTPSTPVDNILSLLQIYKLGVSNHHFRHGESVITISSLRYLRHLIASLTSTYWLCVITWTLRYILQVAADIAWR